LKPCFLFQGMCPGRNLPFSSLPALGFAFADLQLVSSASFGASAGFPVSASFGAPARPFLSPNLLGRITQIKLCAGHILTFWTPSRNIIKPLHMKTTTSELACTSTFSCCAGAPEALLRLRGLNVFIVIRAFAIYENTAA